MSEQLDLPQTETLLRTHFAQLDPGGLRPDAVARIRDSLEAAPVSPRRGLPASLRLAPVGPASPLGRLGLGWSLAAAAVVAILVVSWIALGRLASPPVAATPSVANSPAASAVSGPSASAETTAPSGGIVEPSPSAPISQQRALAFVDRNHGLVVGEYRGQGAVWSTSDGGQTWASTFVQAPALDSVTVLGTRAWASATCSDPTGSPCTPAVLTSTDGGASWSVISSTAVASLTFVDQNVGFGVDASSPGVTHLLTTADGGVTWTAGPTPCETGYFPVGVSFPGATHGWVACGADKYAAGSSPKEVVATTDGGKTWAVRSRGDASPASAIPFAGTFHGIQMLGSGTGIAWLRTEGLIRTTDGGATWARLPLGDAGTGLDWPGASISSDGGLFALTADGTASSATFNLGIGDGRDWKPYVEFARLPAPGTAPTPEPTPLPQPAIADSGVAFFDALHGIAVGNSATEAYLWSTSDGGKTWTISSAHVAHAQLVAVHGKRVWMTLSSCPGGVQPADGSCTTSLSLSDDGGATGLIVSIQRFAAISFGDDTHGFAVGPLTRPGAADTIPSLANGIFETADAGRTWTPVADPWPCQALGPVSVSFVSATHGWVGCAGGESAGQGMKGVMETTDGGKTWAWRSRTGVGGTTAIGSISSSDYLDTISMAADGSGFMTGGRDSTFRTTDGGRTWTSCPPGQFDAYPTSQAAIVPGGPWFVIQSGGNISTDPTVTAAARLMRSDDRGATWTQVGPLLPNP